MLVTISDFLCTSWSICSIFSVSTFSHLQTKFIGVSFVFFVSARTSAPLDNREKRNKMNKNWYPI